MELDTGNGGDAEFAVQYLLEMGGFDGVVLLQGNEVVASAGVPCNRDDTRELILLSGQIDAASQKELDGVEVVTRRGSLYLFAGEQFAVVATGSRALLTPLALFDIRMAVGRLEGRHALHRESQP